MGGHVVTDKPLPHDVATERALLGAMLLDPDSLRMAVELGGGDLIGWFHSQAHATIAAAILDLHEAGEPADPVTVALELGSMLDEVGGRAMLADLVAECPARSNTPRYAAKLIELAHRRQWVYLVAELSQYTRRGEIPPDELLDSLERARAGAAGPGPAGAVFVDWAGFWGKDWESSDWLLEPFIASGRATHVYARRATGKSELMLASVVGLATGFNPLGRGRIEAVPIVYLDSEMGEADLFDRLNDLGHGPGTDLSRLHYAVLPSMPKLNTAAGGKRLLALCRDVGARLVVADSLQSLIDGEENSNDVYDQLHQHTLGPLKREGIASVWTGNTGKDPTKGSRGGSRKEDVMDVIWELRRGDANGVKLVNTKKRMGWVPDEVNLNRRDDGGTIAYRLATDSLPPGTLDTMARLDSAGVPLNASVRDANRALRGTGKGVRTEVLGAALRARREQGAGVSRSAGNTPPGEEGNGGRKHPLDTSADQGETPAGNNGKHQPGRLVVVPPPLGGKHHGPQCGGNDLLDGWDPLEGVDRR